WAWRGGRNRRRDRAAARQARLDDSGILSQRSCVRRLTVPLKWRRRCQRYVALALFRGLNSHSTARKHSSDSFSAALLSRDSESPANFIGGDPAFSSVAAPRVLQNRDKLWILGQAQ